MADSDAHNGASSAGTFVAAGATPLNAEGDPDQTPSNAKNAVSTKNKATRISTRASAKSRKALTADSALEIGF